MVETFLTPLMVEVFLTLLILETQYKHCSVISAQGALRSV